MLQMKLVLYHSMQALILTTVILWRLTCEDGLIYPQCCWENLDQSHISRNFVTHCKQTDTKSTLDCLKQTLN